ncbi:MAG TPA: hypothetical protein VG652_12405 [Gaiellaceae bacterium]|nr:hypothetical protein [Gaiellaceae bacterium]
MNDRRTIERLLRSYPRAWRERYGAELTALLEDGPLSWGVRLDVVRGGVAQRLRSAGLAGDDLPVREQARSGVLLVLCSWAGFVVAGCGFQKFSEHWKDATPIGARAVPAAAFDTLVAAAAIGTVAVLLGIAICLPAFVWFLRAGGWRLIRGRVLRAAVVTAVTIALTAGGAVWASHLNEAQRNGHDAAYSGAAVVWIAFFVSALGLWTAAAVSAARRLELGLSSLRLEALIAGAVTMAMVVMTICDAIWWVSLASSGARQVVVPASGPMAQITALMVVATALAGTGSARSLRLLSRSA